MVYSQLTHEEVTIDNDLPEYLQFYLVNDVLSTILTYKDSYTRQTLDKDLKELTGQTKTQYLREHHADFYKRYIDATRNWRNPLVKESMKRKNLRDRLNKASEYTRVKVVKFPIDQDQQKTNNPIIMKCLDCGENKQTTISKALSAVGCFTCKTAYKKMPNTKQESDALQALTPAQKAKLENWDYTYTTHTRLTPFTCKHCGYVKTTSFYHFINTFSGYCSRCSKKGMSNGEYYVYKTLLTYDIDFEAQYRIAKNDRYYFYDFYVPEQNLLIEYDGDQHRSKVIYNCNRTKEINHSDAVKNQYAAETNTRLLRIWDTNPERVTKKVLKALDIPNTKSVEYYDTKDTDTDAVVEYYRHHNVEETIKKFHKSASSVFVNYKLKYGNPKIEYVRECLRESKATSQNELIYEIYRKTGEITSGRYCEKKNLPEKMTPDMKTWLKENHEKVMTIKYETLRREYFKKQQKPFLTSSQVSRYKRRHINKHSNN